MAHLYSDLLAIAETLQAGLVVVHHMGKGDNSVKTITDLGAGLGVQSRACDAHLTLREHAEPDCVVFDGVVRAWCRSRRLFCGGGIRCGPPLPSWTQAT